MNTLRASLSISFALVLAAASGVSTAPRPASAAPGGPELVQSAPAETSLAQPGLALASDVWPAMIRGARKSIDLGQMYVAHKAGEALEPVLHELAAAGKRGVKVRVLLSKNMWATDPAAIEALKAIPGAEVRSLDLSKLTGGIIHSKYWIVDGRETFVGSQNLDWRALSQIQELGVRMADPAIAKSLAEIFEIDWKLAQTGAWPFPQRPEPPAPGKPPAIELVASPARLNPPGVRSSLPVLLELIGAARSSVRVQLLNYSTIPHGGGPAWKVVDDALVAAARRGVKVELLVSHWNADNQGDLNSLKALARVPGITVRILTVPLASSGPIPYARVIHSKYMTVDGETLWLGTSNWSRGYFLDVRGVELVFRSSQQGAALARQADALYDRLLASGFVELVDERTAVRPRGF